MMLRCIIFVTLFAVSATAMSEAGMSVIIPNPPPLSAKQYILMDYETGAILAEKRIEEAVEPASLTKLMTAYVVYRALDEGLIKLTDEVKVSRRARQAIGSRMFIEEGSLVSVEDLLKGIVIQSGNDASIALAEHVAHSEAGFVDLMNDEARRLGLNQSNFVNTTGLPDEAGNHKMSAHDIALLSQALIRDFPEYYKMYAEREFAYSDITQSNRNRLLWRGRDIDGLKTGYTESAEYCLAASARREGMRLLAVVLGSPGDQQRFDDTMRLLNYGFKFYKTHRLYEANKPLDKIRVWGGARKFVEFGVIEDFYVIVPRNAKGKLQVDKIVHDSISSPVSLHQELGVIKVGFMKDEVRQAPLLALSEVAQGSWMIRLRDSFLKLF